MAKLTYWLARCKDSATFNLRGRTKKELLDKIKLYDKDGYQLPEKIVVEYKDAFHLLTGALEGLIEY